VVACAQEADGDRPGNGKERDGMKRVIRRIVVVGLVLLAVAVVAAFVFIKRGVST
jgi:hypothetical protein